MLHKDPIKIFLHIAKTGGSSLSYAIQRELLKGALYQGGQLGLIRKNFPFIKKGNRIQFIAGHNTYYAKFFLKRPYRYITILRDPLDRYLSHYSYTYNNFLIGCHRNILKQRIFLNCSLNRYMSMPWTHNCQTKALSGLWGFPMDKMFFYTPRWALKVAKRNVREFGLVLDTDELSISDRKIANFLGLHSLTVQRDNITNRQYRIRLEDLSLQQVARLKNINKMDLQLYEYFKSH